MAGAEQSGGKVEHKVLMVSEESAVGLGNCLRVEKPTFTTCVTRNRCIPCKSTLD